jgi:peptide/nickel transport system ATP-binding protein
MTALTDQAGVGDAPLLEVSDLNIRFATADGAVPAVRGASWQVRRGQTLGLVGESGSGKSATAFAVLGLHDPTTRIDGSIKFGGQELVGAPEQLWSRVRGKDVAMIFQDALDSLNPFRTVGAQIAEAARLHQPLSRTVAMRKAVEMLDRVGVREPHRRAKDYPHQFSGGMRQRVMIAAALINEPAVLLADEPTTALDSTVQAQVLDLLSDLQREMGMAIVLVTHDFGVVQHVCSDVAVMYRGRVLETGPVNEVLRRGRHPYTRALIASVLTMGDEPDLTLPTVPDMVRALGAPHDPEKLADPALRVGPDMTLPLPSRRSTATSERPGTGHPALLEVRGLSVTHLGRLGRPGATAVNDVSFSIAPGEAFGLVGESGSGKSTIARVVTGLQAPSAGSVLLDGTELRAATVAQRRQLSRKIQMVFQDPYGSLNPDRTVGDSIGAPLTVRVPGSQRPPNRASIRAKVRSLLAEVGLDPDLMSAYPDQLSGGMRQRAGIARALIVGPKILVADEAVSALDVSVQAQVLNLLADLRERHGLALLFISHDLAVVRYMCTVIAVLERGRIAEIGRRDQMMEEPRSDHTRALLEAAHTLDRG